MPKALDFLAERAADCASSLRGPPRSSRAGRGRLLPCRRLPDLPASVEWPVGIGQRGVTQGFAGFLAQIDLADVPVIQSLPLPRRGKLWLFVRRVRGHREVRDALRR